MTDLHRDVLRTLRIFGPISNREVAKRLKAPLHKTYRALQTLTDDGLAVHPGIAQWDVSDQGRQRFADLLNGQLFKESADAGQR